MRKSISYRNAKCYLSWTWTWASLPSTMLKLMLKKNLGLPSVVFYDTFMEWSKLHLSHTWLLLPGEFCSKQDADNLMENIFLHLFSFLFIVLCSQILYEPLFICCNLNIDCVFCNSLGIKWTSERAHVSFALEYTVCLASLPVENWSAISQASL